MCCRYYLPYDPDITEALDRLPLAISMRDKLGRSINTAGEVRPTDIVPAFAPSKASAITLFPMVFGFSGKFFNTRLETAATKPMWKDSWASHRCALPFSWYYEWRQVPTEGGRKATKEKMLIQPVGFHYAYFAGLYRIEESAEIKYPTFTILTTTPSPSVSDIHDRMPVILAPDKIEEWVDPRSRPETVVKTALTDMMVDVAPPEAPRIYA